MHSLTFYVSACATLAHVVAGGYVKVNYNKEYVNKPLVRREIPVSDLDENITLAIQGSVSRLIVIEGGWLTRAPGLLARSDHWDSTSTIPSATRYR